MREVKLLISGIQAAGKTSILRVLDDDFVTLHSLQPTPGVERSMVEVLGMKFHRWDMGGQETYRTRYLEDMERYFGGLALLIYVIDIQDEQFMEESITYLENILEFIKTQEKKPHVAVFFHKFDPEVYDNNALHARMREYMERIDNLRGEVKMDYYPTSIFDRATLTMVFSQVILQVYPRREIVEDELGKLRQSLETPVLAVANSTPFILGHVVSEELQAVLQKRFNHLLITNVNLLRHRLEMPDYQVDLFDTKQSLLLAPFEIKDEPYFLAGLWDREIFADPQKLESFKIQLGEGKEEVEKILSLFYG